MTDRKHAKEILLSADQLSPELKRQLEQMDTLTKAATRHVCNLTEVRGLAGEVPHQFVRVSDLTRANAAIIESQAKLNEALRLSAIAHIQITPLNLPDFPQIDWKASQKSQIEGVTHLANCGWTVAGWMTAREVSKLKSANSKMIDAFFHRNYLTRYKKHNELNRLYSDLLSSPELNQWKKLLKEVVFSMEKKRYRICVPALLTVLEGFISDVLVKQGSAKRRHTKVHVQLTQVKRDAELNIHGLMRMSVEVFLSHLFADSDFGSTPPRFINRHWILHGRLATEWTAMDAIKLLNALGTAKAMFPALGSV